MFSADVGPGGSSRYSFLINDVRDTLPKFLEFGHFYFPKNRRGVSKFVKVFRSLSNFIKLSRCLRKFRLTFRKSYKRIGVSMAPEYRNVEKALKKQTWRTIRRHLKTKRLHMRLD